MTGGILLQFLKLPYGAVPYYDLVVLPVLQKFKPGAVFMVLGERAPLTSFLWARPYTKALTPTP